MRCSSLHRKYQLVAVTLLAAWIVALAWLDVAGADEPTPNVSVHGSARYVDGAPIGRGVLHLLGDGVEGRLAITEGTISGTMPQPGSYVVERLELDSVSCVSGEPIDVVIEKGRALSLHFLRPRSVTLRVVQPDGSPVKLAWAYMVLRVGSSVDPHEFGEQHPRRWDAGDVAHLSRNPDGGLVTLPIYDLALVRVGASNRQTRLIEIRAPSDLQANPCAIDVVLPLGIGASVYFPAQASRAGRRVDLRLPDGIVQTYTLDESDSEITIIGLPGGAYTIGVNYLDARTERWVYAERKVTCAPPMVAFVIADL
jgi:hypothetical protein